MLGNLLSWGGDGTDYVNTEVCFRKSDGIGDKIEEEINSFHANHG
jgi:hypothetical protein